MKYTRTICITFSSVLLGACVPPSVDVEAERTALRAAADAYHEAGEAMNVDRFVGFYATDGLMFPPNAAAENGREGVRSFISAFAELPDAGVSFSEPIVEVAASGDIGYTLADAVVRFEGSDGEAVKEKIRDFHLWKKQNGEWKLAIDIWNSETPLPGAAATSSLTTSEEDAVIVDPEHYAVEFENDRVRIIRIKYGPGEKSVMHTHGPNAAIFLTQNTMRMNLPDGTSEELTTEFGATQWADSEKHLPENLSDNPVEVVLVELKE